MVIQNEQFRITSSENTIQLISFLNKTLNRDVEKLSAEHAVDN
jgi:hypothetical protein